MTRDEIHAAFGEKLLEVADLGKLIDQGPAINLTHLSF